MSALRQAVATDLPQMWEVRYSVTENTLAPGRINDDEFRQAIQVTGRGWVIEAVNPEAEAQIQAFAVGNGITGNVWALFVRPQAQGRGYGSRLHTAMLGWFRTQAIGTLWLSTGTHTQARKFYEQHGWQCVGPYGDDEVRYERPNHA